ncbi:rRNA-processing protein bfr2 [Emydomyces testavorans]|uniref:Protein BFR2 n=1 Tax=Emydomyces testavorans TaxID=2070801 RepID=A0AAF0IID0_9EURO|nr:rRNA-processing protein bfr2 [Emydomyces testavorans]
MAGIKSKTKSLAEQIAELEDPTPKDFDPEDQSNHAQTSDDDELSADGRDVGISGREHYEVVGKSKLRKPLAVELGREYAGSRVSRDVLEADGSEHDPFASVGNEEDSGMTDEEDQFGLENEIEGDAEEEEEEEEEQEEGYEIEDVNGVDESERSGDTDEEEDTESEELDEDEEHEKAHPSHERKDVTDYQDELRRLMASDHKAVATSISQATKADAAKGAAVKRQRRAFDALLNSRIKLQKGLTSLNDLQPNPDEDDASTQEELINSAEAAALALWTALDDLRHALADSRSKATSPSSKKRKRTPITASTPSSDIWSQMQALESQSLPHRRAILDKWSLKARGIRAALPSNQSKLLANKSDQQTITAVLDAHLATTETSSSTTTIPHPHDAKPSAAQPPSKLVYDDTTFYQSLLRDLVEQRMSSAAAGAATTFDSQLQSRLTSLSIHPTTGMRKVKIKRAVDTKASKGRKMRYNVHEKLQNFMAPEERGSWGNRVREEFFASLLGRSARKVLGEDDEDEGENGVGSDEEDIEEGGLRLFRN